MEQIKLVILILLFALIGGQISVRSKLPAVIGQLIAGVILGPAFLNWVRPNSLIKNLAEIGVILLMFLAGLESDLTILKKLWYPSLLVALLGMIVPIIVAYLTGLLFAFAPIDCLYLGLIFAATSVSISVAVLQELGCLRSKEGMTILGAAVVDDILSILLLSIASSLFNTQRPVTTAKYELAWHIFCQIGYLLVLIIGSFWLAPRLVKLWTKITVPAANVLLLLVIILVASFGAEFVGLSDVIGAFFVGLAFSQLNEKAKLQENFTTIGYGFFIPLFFISIGLEMTLTGIWQNIGLFVLLLIGAILSKWGGAGIGAKLSGFSFLSSIQIGAGMVSRGEMALIVAQISRQKHFLTSTTYSLVVGVIILTTLIAPFLLKLAFTDKQ